MTRESGLTIIELMVVVAIIIVVIGVAIPSLAASRKSANETAASSLLRSLVTMNEQYRLRFGRFAPSPSALHAAGFAPGARMAIKITGYRFAYAGDRNTWRCVARPAEPGQTGDRGFYVDESGLVRAAEWSRIGPDSPPLDGFHETTRGKGSL